MHQGYSGLDQANGAVAQIMCLPATLRNPVASEQPPGYRAIAVFLIAAVKRPQRKYQTLASLQRQRRMPCSRLPLPERGPQPVRRAGPQIEFAVERQFEDHR
jgi:hypothetical protein